MKSKSLEKDLENIRIPFNLFAGLTFVVEELKDKGFEYSNSTQEVIPVITFESLKREEIITINVEPENLLIKQFTVDKDKRKLKVLYVLKPSERQFKLI